MPPQVQLAGLQTEERNPRSSGIDCVSTQELCRILNQEDVQVPAAVERCIPVIAQAVDALCERVRNGGRVFYIGAGTSGRLGVLDASEIPPTYSAPTDQFVALIAGGDGALRRAKEGAEDSRDGAEADLRSLDMNPEVDSLIGIASSGRTPYVLGGLSYARALGCTTVGVVCVDPSAVGEEGNADFLVAAVTGPEVVTGSTRMKAGTATKLVLNMISTGIMIKMGKTYGNLMIDLKATNVKLKQRAKNILRAVSGTVCSQSEEELEDILEDCNGSVKLAAVVIVLNTSVPDAGERLQRHKGVLARVFEEAAESRVQQATDEGFVLCVDAGGTSCKAVILSKDGRSGSGTAGPCNVTTSGLDAAISSISKAVQGAIDNCEATKGRQFESVDFSSAWIGMAGYDRPSLAPLIDEALSKLLRLSGSSRLRVTTDIDLLPTRLASHAGLDSVIVVVAGTGSVAMSFQREAAGFRRTGRAGGWGHLLGDDGSGFGIGREVLRKVLLSQDASPWQKTASESSVEPPSPLSRAVLEHFRQHNPDFKPHDLLSTILVSDPTTHQVEGTASGAANRIAGVSEVALSMADTDEDARCIVEAGAASLAQLVVLLASGQGIEPAKSALVLAGGLMQDESYRNLVLKVVEEKCRRFAHIEAVQHPAAEGARHLRRIMWGN